MSARRMVVLALALVMLAAAVRIAWQAGELVAGDIATAREAR